MNQKSPTIPIIVKKSEPPLVKAEAKPTGNQETELEIPKKYSSKEALQKSLDRNILRLAELQKRIINKEQDVSDRRKWLEMFDLRQK